MELRNRNIIIFSQMQFDGRLESTNYTLAKYLAKNNKVYYVDRPFTWRDYMMYKNTPAFKIRKPHFFSPPNSIIQTEIPNLKIVICPPVPSINMLPEGKIYRLAVKMNELIVASRVKKVIKQFSIDDYIYINSYNYTYPNFHNLIKPLLTVYHCVDPLIEVYQTRHGLISEDIVVKNVDLVICTSNELRNKKLKLNHNTHLIPNAANINHSQKALDPELPVAAVLSGIGKPIIGYFGNIERRVDYNLLKELLDQNPDKNFAFVGPVDNNYADMSVFERPNAFLTGAVPYEQMPAVLKGFDVAIIPFKKDEVSSSIFPLKLFEYLGSGKPTVSSNFNTDLKEFTKDTVAYCKTAEEFTIAINEALKDTPELQKKRLAVAAENTWEHRVIEIEKLLALNLKLKLKAINQ